MTIINNIHSLKCVDAFYYDPDNESGKKSGMTDRESRTNRAAKNGGLGIAILYHKSIKINDNKGLGWWEYAMPDQPKRFNRIPNDIGWPQKQLPKVFLIYLFLCTCREHRGDTKRPRFL